MNEVGLGKSFQLWPLVGTRLTSPTIQPHGRYTSIHSSLVRYSRSPRHGLSSTLTRGREKMLFRMGHQSNSYRTSDIGMVIRAIDFKLVRLSPSYCELE